jgi:hypothetical protein
MQMNLYLNEQYLLALPRRLLALKPRLRRANDYSVAMSRDGCTHADLRFRGSASYQWLAEQVSSRVNFSPC